MLSSASAAILAAHFIAVAAAVQDHAKSDLLHVIMSSAQNLQRGLQWTCTVDLP